jgi:hypothetical protein
LQKCIDELLLCHATELGKKFCAYNDAHKWTAKKICVNGMLLKTHSMEAETYLEDALHAILLDRVFLQELTESGRESHASLPGAADFKQRTSYYVYDEIRLYSSIIIKEIMKLR